MNSPFNYTFPHNVEFNLNSIEALSFAKCWLAYSECCPTANIFSIGWNPYEQNAYIELCNGVSITSNKGQRVLFVTEDDGAEFPFTHYKDALECIERTDAHKAENYFYRPL